MLTHPKTLHLTNAFHSSSGGVATSYLALLSAANREGRLMRLVVPSDRDGVEKVGRFGLIYYVSAPRSKVFDKRYRLILPQRYLLTRSGPIWDILRSERPDLLEVRDKFCLNWIGGLFRKGWHKGVTRPVLVGSTSERMDDLLRAYVASGMISVRFARWYMRYCYVPLFDSHIANSSYTADEIRRSMIAKHERPVFVCTEGVDCQTFDPGRRNEDLRASLLEEAGGTERSTLLLYSGRLSPEKNVGLIVDVMKKLAHCKERDFRLAVAGSGPLAESLVRGMEQSAPGRSQFLAHITDKEYLAQLYASCDIFIHPNPREPFGIAPLEAMASGLALVAPSSGGVLSYADESNSWLVPANADAFAKAVLEAAEPEIRAPKATSARARAEQFDWSIVAPRFFSTYDKLIESHSGSLEAAKSAMSVTYD